MPRQLFLTHNGITQTCAAWSRATGIPGPTIRGRYHRGEPVAAILTKDHPCLDCGIAVARHRVRCPACDVLRTRSRCRLRQRTHTLATRQAPGVNKVGHCGVFHDVPMVPFWFPCCGTLLTWKGDRDATPVD